MSSYTLTTTVNKPYDATVDAVRVALQDQAEPSVAAVLPCNGVVRAVDETTTGVEAFDPDAMMGLAGNADTTALRRVAADAKRRLNGVLGSLAEEG